MSPSPPVLAAGALTNAREALARVGPTVNRFAVQQLECELNCLLAGKAVIHGAAEPLFRRRGPFLRSPCCCRVLRNWGLFRWPYEQK